MAPSLAAAVAIPAEGDNGVGFALVMLLLAAAIVVLLAPLAYLIWRDAERRGRNGWVWGVVFVWQPVIVGIIYLIVRRRPPRSQEFHPGWYPDATGSPQMRRWNGRRWTDEIRSATSESPDS